MKPDLSICIINYNTPDKTKRCLESLSFLQGKVNLEVILVDNSVSDENSFQNESFSPWFSFKYIKSMTNKYFSGGFNTAFEHASGELILILNNDCYFHDDSLIKMIKYIENDPSIGACEGIIIDEGTKEITKTSSRELTRFRDLVRSSRILKKICFKVLKDYSYSGWDRKSTREVEAICDAFMLIRANLYKEIKGFDESMKLYFTEEYLSDKIRSKGFKITHFSGSSVIHSWQSSTSKISSKRVKTIYDSDKMNYFSLKT